MGVANYWLPATGYFSKMSLTGSLWILWLYDVCDQIALDKLRAINPRLTVVLGNNDFELDSPVSLDLDRLALLLQGGDPRDIESESAPREFGCHSR